jgi:hypothetical protein
MTMLLSKSRIACRTLGSRNAAMLSLVVTSFVPIAEFEFTEMPARYLPLK